LPHFERNRSDAVAAREFETTLHERVGDSFPAFALRYGDLVHMHLVEEPHGENIADQRTAAVRDEVEARLCGELALKKLTPPRRGKSAHLQPVDGVEIGPSRRSDLDIGICRWR
jgi:hypothetical protein